MRAGGSRRVDADPGGWAWARAFWRALRPAFWVVSIFPLHMGWVLASRQIFPGLAIWLDFWARAGAGGATAGEFGAALGAWGVAAGPWLGAMVAIGPLLGGATLLHNNAWDLQADRANPRRQQDPLVLGLVSERQARWGARLLAALGLAVAAWVGPLFLGFMAACWALAWAYSAPPLRAKGVAGLDVAVNVLGLGVLCTFAGWSLAAPLRDFPWPFMVLPVLHLASTYVPTTLVDYPTDKAFGYQTIAVRLGPERAFWVGFAFAVAGNAVFLVAALLDYIVPWKLYVWLWPFTVVELVAYLGLRRWDDLRRFALSLLVAVASFGAGVALFLLHYAGWLRL
ncbi:MAG TPA: UbiA family prenyltransferase [Candidatus Thermoplasmatota archaeon]|jgi:chlorophyll synthase|nr:UbiA family prenyltransferase [Candidatus Thermoplasmatota archaeon]